MYVERLHELGVRGFILTGGGEPTINPDFDNITAWLDGRGFPYGINTNFNVLRKPRPKYLKVSLDGWDEDSYQVQRGVRRYRQVRKNIVEYAGWKVENSPSTALGIQMVATDAGDVEKFYEANKDLPVDYIVFRPIESRQGEYYHDPKEIEEARQIAEVVNGLRETDSRVVLNFKFNLLGAACKKCNANWAQMAMDEKGDIMYCCHKPYQIIGHVMDRSILRKKAEATTDMAMCDIPCRLTDANLLMQKIEEGMKDPFFI
jgi:MoaA/NifB/PqqE/SkfB family radical SAM enzyme